MSDTSNKNDKSSNNKDDKKDQATEKQIDKTLEDSFPASDPPAVY